MPGPYDNNRNHSSDAYLLPRSFFSTHLPRGFMSIPAVLAAVLLSTALASAQQSNATLHGRVLDAQTGEPIAKATVAITGLSVITDAEGRFTLTPIPPGPLDLRISTIGYGLLKVHLDTPAEPLTFRLGQDALRDTQQITVTAHPFDPVIPNAPTQSTLDGVELQDLSTVLLNDPLRAVANLPGVAANNDAYADFASRGAGPTHTGVYLDGVLLDHPVYGLEDAGSIGSISVVNGDTVGSIALLPSAFPPQFGDRTGAILDIATRDGARDRVVTRLTADVLGLVATSEGPLGRIRKGSWLVSGRQSYLAYLLRRLDSAQSLTLNDHDASGSLAYDLTPHQAFRLVLNYGSDSAQRAPAYIAGQQSSFFTHGSGRHAMASLHWNWTPAPGTALATQAYWVHDSEFDTNLTGATDLSQSTNLYGGRSDLTQKLGHANNLTAGVELRSQHQRRDSTTQWYYTSRSLSTTVLPFDTYTATSTQFAAYAEDTASLLGNKLKLTAGTRLALYGPTTQAVFLPHLNATLQLAAATTVTLAFALYAQQPTLQQLYGAFGTPTLKPERAAHSLIALDQFLSPKLRLHAELYDREEHNDINSSRTEFRLLPNGDLTFPEPGPVLQNSLHAYSRGFEIQLQRRSANGLSGWLSYTRAATQYAQPGTTFRYQGDFDQRNTVSAYAAYRLTRTIAISANSRYGSGLPIPGYLAPSNIPAPGGGSSQEVYFFLSSQRNTLHTAAFARTDARISKVFNRRHFNLTIHGELENLTAHTNLSYYAFAVAPPYATTTSSNPSPYVYASRQSTLPLLPAAGLTFEF